MATLAPTPEIWEVQGKTGKIYRINMDDVRKKVFKNTNYTNFKTVLYRLKKKSITPETNCYTLLSALNTANLYELIANIAMLTLYINKDINSAVLLKSVIDIINNSQQNLTKRNDTDEWLRTIKDTENIYNPETVLETYPKYSRLEPLIIMLRNCKSYDLVTLHNHVNNYCKSIDSIIENLRKHMKESELNESIARIELGEFKLPDIRKTLEDIKLKLTNLQTQDYDSKLNTISYIENMWIDNILEVLETKSIEDFINTANETTLFYTRLVRMKEAVENIFIMLVELHISILVVVKIQKKYFINQIARKVVGRYETYGRDINTTINDLITEYNKDISTFENNRITTVIQGIQKSVESLLSEAPSSASLSSQPTQKSPVNPSSIKQSQKINIRSGVSATYGNPLFNKEYFPHYQGLFNQFDVYQTEYTENRASTDKPYLAGIVNNMAGVLLDIARKLSEEK